MRIFAIGEPDYKTSNWYREIIEGLMSEKRRRRFSLMTLSATDELQTRAVGRDDVAFLIGTNSAWLAGTVALCESLFDNRVVVLGNYNLPHDGKRFSVVTSDIARDVRLLVDYLRACQKSRIALYGVNPESASDAFKKESFLACGMCTADLYYNEGSLADCFASFSAKAKAYDGVICVNDYAALSLMHHLEGEPRPFVVSCGGSMLADRASPTVTHTTVEYHAFAGVGIELARMLCDNPGINSIRVLLSGGFTAGESTEHMPLPVSSGEAARSVSKKEDKFYSDLEIDEMMKVEQLLSRCNDEDLLILERLLSGATYGDIAKELYMSENGIKYKLKNMFRLCGVPTRADFIRTFGKYL
ncbi:MAG: hypothetical protein IJX39_07775 [Clostridia bacterium]|nr:hypothetical protein [Clostridia bacterium]